MRLFRCLLDFPLLGCVFCLSHLRPNAQWLPACQPHLCRVALKDSRLCQPAVPLPQLVFNPKDTNTFASASLDRTIKVGIRLAI